MFEKRGPGDQRNLRTRDWRNGTQNEATFGEMWDPQRTLCGCQVKDIGGIQFKRKVKMVNWLGRRKL